MKLLSFRAQNYRSINDSGEIKLTRITSLLGRNESGKTNLLLALQSINPAEGFVALNKIKDFPRHRRLEECKDDTEVLSTQWELDESEKQELTKLLPRASSVTTVGIGRYYAARRWVSLNGLPDISYDAKDIQIKIRKIVPVIKAKAAKLEDENKAQLEARCEKFESDITPIGDMLVWATRAVPALATLRQALASVGAELTESQDQLVSELEELANDISNDANAQQKARNWVVEQLPIFIYLDEYPELKGHQNITQYIQRKNGNQSLSAAERDFEKLCKVAGLSPQILYELLGQNKQEERNQLANRAGAVVTSEIRRLWKDRALKVRFNLDAEHMDTLISDPNAVYDVEVNLDERSRGFRWFFSFYITFSADTNAGEAENAILLLDEPGLYLHATSQSDLLVHLNKDFDNQIIYTTHSPFMVPTHDLSSIRTVNISEDTGTTVTNDPTGDSRTLFPLQAALGYNLVQSLFVGPNNLIVEGVTDYWVLSSISQHLAANKGTAITSELTLTPAGGAQKIPYMVALLTSERLNVLVLFDEEKDAKSTMEELVKSKLLREQNIIFISEAYETNPPSEADIEDLIDPDVYIELVRVGYTKELSGKTLKLNDKIPRIVKRVEEAFSELGIEFHKTRPARILLDRMASEPEKIVTTDTQKRFERLFSIINQRYSKHISRNSEPFR